MNLDELMGRALEVAGAQLTLRVEVHPRVPGGRAVSVHAPDGARTGALSVCVWGVQLAEDELLVKTTTANAPIVDAARATGWFEATGRIVPLGFCNAEVWRLIR